MANGPAPERSALDRVIGSYKRLTAKREPNTAGANPTTPEAPPSNTGAPAPPTSR